jgi:hypothetical protein
MTATRRALARLLRAVAGAPPQHAPRWPAARQLSTGALRCVRVKVSRCGDETLA